MASQPVGSPALSVVIPSFNSVDWLPTTLAALDAAIAASSWRAEIVVVDDGSTDGTADRVGGLPLRAPVRVLVQPNQGRFLARWNGAQAAAAPLLLFIDSRVLIDEGALRYVEDVMTADPGQSTWNGHVPTDPSTPLVGRFWEVPTQLFWWRYLGRPHPMTITPDNFDTVPKGTTMFLVPRQAYLTAAQEVWPEGDARLVSDDTRLIRRLVAAGPVRLDPGFSALYRPRQSVKNFLRHAADRGTLFVDSYAGTGHGRDLILLGLLAAPVLALVGVVAALILGGPWMAVVLSLLVGILVAPVVVALVRGVAPRAALAYLVYVLPFVVVFWAGLIRGAAMYRRKFFTSVDPEGTR